MVEFPPVLVVGMIGGRGLNGNCFLFGSLFNKFEEFAPAANDPNNNGFCAASAGNNKGLAPKNGFNGIFGVGIGNGNFSFKFNFGLSKGTFFDDVVEDVLDDVVVTLGVFVLFILVGLLFDEDVLNFGDMDLALVGVVDEEDAFDDVTVEVLLFSVEGILVLEPVLAGGDFSCGDEVILVFEFVDNGVFIFVLSWFFFFKLGTILGIVVADVFIFFNGLFNAKAGFMAAIKACIFARAAVLGKTLGCLFNDGRVPNGNTDDKSNGFIFINNCEIAGILFKFGKADVFNGRLVDNDGDDVEGNGILLFNVDPNLFKFDAIVEFVVLFEVPTGNEFDNGNKEGIEDDIGVVDAVGFFVVEFEGDVEASLLELFLDLLVLFIEGGMSEIGDELLILLLLSLCILFLLI